MVRVIAAAVLAAAAQFVWGFVFFGFLSGMEFMTSRAPNETAVTEALKSTLPESGTYLIPSCPGHSATEEARMAFANRHAEGPLVQIHYRKDGMSMAQLPVVMGAGFVQTTLTALLAALLLRTALPGLAAYRNRVGFVFVLGVFAATATRLSDLIWLHQPWAFPLGQMVFCATAWLLAGVILAAIIRPAAHHAVVARSHPQATSAA
jgi:hypothetical protein